MNLACFRGIWEYQRDVQIGGETVPVHLQLPGIFPATVPVAGRAAPLEMKHPINRLLGLPHDKAYQQLWGRALMKLLGHSLGIRDDAEVNNENPAELGDHVGNRRAVKPPDPYGRWDRLRLAPNNEGVIDLDSSLRPKAPKPQPDIGPAHIVTISPPYDTAPGSPKGLIEEDGDLDGVVSDEDNCPEFFNPPRFPNLQQENADDDRYGDECDGNIDGRFGLDVIFGGVVPDVLRRDQIGGRTALGLAAADDVDLLPFDSDDDGQDNSADPDDDNDDVPDSDDSCPIDPDSSQVDRDSDGIGDACDRDVDGDGFPNELEIVAGSNLAASASGPEILEVAPTCSDGQDNDLDGQIDGDDSACKDADADGISDRLDGCPNQAGSGVDENANGVGDLCEAPPTADDASIATTVDTPIAITLSASDPDGDRPAFGIVQSPTHGTLSALTEAELTYTPTTGYQGPDSFTFQACDPPELCDTAVVTISVNAGEPPPALSVGDVTVTEGDSGQIDASFALSLSTASSQSVKVDFDTADGTATAPGDYATKTGMVEFAPGDTSRTITVGVSGDTLDEPNETFTVKLANATNATIDDATGVGTITDDDSPPALSVGDVTVGEGDAGQTNAEFALSLSTASSQTVTVDLDTADATATAPGDYAAKSETIEFASGQTTKTITVAVNGDTLDEPNETFTVKLANATNATIDDATGVGTIEDDDSPSPAPGGLMKGSGIVMDTADSHQDGWKAKHASNEYRARLDCSANGERQRFAGMIEEAQRW